MNQLERARAALNKLRVNALDKVALNDLEVALSEAQNGPPEGAADGSIDELLWSGLQRVARACQGLQGAVAIFDVQTKFDVRFSKGR